MTHSKGWSPFDCDAIAAFVFLYTILCFYELWRTYEELSSIIFMLIYKQGPYVFLLRAAFKYFDNILFL